MISPLGFRRSARRAGGLASRPGGWVISPLGFRRSATSRERGATLIELTVVVGIMMLVVAVMLDSLGSAQRSERYAADRTEALDNMRFAIARFTKDVRQSAGVAPGATAQRFEMDTYVEGGMTTVVYEATGDEMRRTVGSNPTEVLIDRLSSVSVFDFVPSAESAEVVTITLVVEPETSPDTTIELTSEVRMRNRGST